MHKNWSNIAVVTLNLTLQENYFQTPPENPIPFHIYSHSLKTYDYEFIDSISLTLVLGASPSVCPGGGHH